MNIRAEAWEQAVQEAEAAYPEDVFVPPPPLDPGEQGVFVLVTLCKP